MTIVYLVAGWLAGIAAARAFGEAVVWWVWLLMGVVAAAAAILLRSRDERAALLAGSTALFLLGGMAYTLATPEFGPEDVAAYNDEGRVALTGRIVAMPDVRDTHVNLRVRAETLEPEGDDRHNVNGLVLVQAPRGTDYAYGDMVRVLGELNTPPAFDTFSYRDYLARENVYSLMQYTFVEVTEEGGGNPVRRALIGFRQHADRTITRLLPDPAASLLSGILLGIETGISPDVREAFNAVSATHVIAISGSNLVVLAGVIDAVSRRFVPGRTAAVLTIGGVIGYAIFVGADAAVIRAAIMVTLYILANLLGRETFGLASLAFAAFLMTALNPLTLWDVGFQLSFLATLGLMLYVAPMQAGLEQILTNLIDAERAREIVGGLSDMLLVTIAAQITTTPIMAYHFGRFSIAAFPVNLLIVPVQGPLMILGGIGVLLAMIVFPLGQLVTWGSYLFLMWTVGVVRFFASMPFASVDLTLSAGATAAIYIVLFGATALAMAPTSTRERILSAASQLWTVKLAAGGGLIAAVLLLAGSSSLPDGRLHVWFIDVGDGTSTLIQTPSGRRILVDGGPSGRQLSTALGDAMPFWDRRIDLLVMSGQSEAHLAGLAGVLDRYQIGAVMYTGHRGESSIAREVWSQLEEQDLPLTVPTVGTRIEAADGVRLTVMDPGSDDTPIVLMLIYEEARFLLTGDLDETTQAALGQQSIDATVLQVPDNGHERVSSEDFLGMVSPQVSVISVGANNRFGLPHEATLSRLQDVTPLLYRTDQHGTIHMWTDGSLLWIRER